MANPPPPLRRGPLEQVAAWLVTGPIGHFWSIAVDVGSYALRTLFSRLADARRARSG